jgi:hypothetical protein
MAVIARLRPGTEAEAARLIELGPPFDPEAADLERHSVFLAADVVVFVFEGANPSAILRSLGDPDEQSVLAAWEPLLEGTPLIARETYAWTRPSMAFDASWGE